MFTHNPYEWNATDPSATGEMDGDAPFSPTQPSWSGRNVDKTTEISSVAKQDTEVWDDPYGVTPDEDGYYHSPCEEELLFVIVGVFRGYRGSICSQHLEEEVRRNHSDLHSRVIWDLYGDDWHKFLVAHPECVCVEFDQKRPLPWRVRLSDSDLWHQEDGNSELMTQRTEQILCHILQQKLHRNQHGIRLMDVKKTYDRLSHAGVVETPPGLLPPLTELSIALLKSNHFVLDGDRLHRRIHPH